VNNKKKQMNNKIEHVSEYIEALNKYNENTKNKISKELIESYHSHKESSLEGGVIPLVNPDDYSKRKYLIAKELFEAKGWKVTIKERHMSDSDESIPRWNTTIYPDDEYDIIKRIVLEIPKKKKICNKKRRLNFNVEHKSQKIDTKNLSRKIYLSEFIDCHLNGVFEDLKVGSLTLLSFNPQTYLCNFHRKIFNDVYNSIKSRLTFGFDWECGESVYIDKYKINSKGKWERIRNYNPEKEYSGYKLRIIIKKEGENKK